MDALRFAMLAFALSLLGVTMLAEYLLKGKILGEQA
jgi:hypothetical protein